MKNQTLIEWLEDLCLQLDEPEKPLFRTDYGQGLADGATDTQKLIAQKIRYAVEQEKARLTKRVPDRAKSAVKKSSSTTTRKSTRRGR